MRSEMKRALCVLALAGLSLTFANHALAHGIIPIQPEALWRVWSFDPLVIAPLLLAHLAYGRGLFRLWARAGRGRGITGLNVLSFLLGESVLVVALISPLDQLGGTLLSAHMAQHGLLVAAAPPLLLLGKPGVAFAWALPTGWNRISVLAGATRLTALLSRPLVAAVLHGLAVWIWHAPNLFDAAVEREWLHALEHASFFGTALLLWRAVLVQPRRQAGPALGAALATLLHSGLLGALLTMAPYPLYSWYRDGRTELWGLSALGDQQLAGLLMWVPLGVFYFAACLVLTARLIGSEQLQHRST